MKKFNVFVCENFYPELQYIFKKENFDNVTLVKYPALCINKTKTGDVDKLLLESSANREAGLVFCNKQCEIIKMIPIDDQFEVCSTNLCCGHLANETFLDEIVKNRGFLIKTGWLNQWQDNIKNQGFDRETASAFYKSNFDQLVFLDTGIDQDAEIKLKALSQFLDIPYAIKPVEIEFVKAQFESAVYKWQMAEKEKEYQLSITEIQSQSAEYATLLELIGKISAYSSKRDTIDRIKDIFVTVFGIRKFKFWRRELETGQLANEIEAKFSNSGKAFFLSDEENRFCIKIQYGEKLYGAIDVSDFLFPQHIEKYLTMAIAIVKICGLVLANNEQYENIIKTEKELQFLSFHDTLTNLYNRTYVNAILKKHTEQHQVAVFMFDIDRLKYVNDNYGHSEGDKMIINAANIIKNCFRESDMVARIGGDEFLTILSRCNIEKADLIGHRITSQIVAFNKSQSEEHQKISLSMGIVVADQTDQTIESLMIRADELMNIDKQNKRNNWRLPNETTLDLQF